MVKSQKESFTKEISYFMCYKNKKLKRLELTPNPFVLFSTAIDSTPIYSHPQHSVRQIDKQIECEKHKC